ncbi:MAG: hypothetical protein E6Q97_08555 [Desulfurellales bacterium]|nr:MAG: hypothetical protein E6Q97_08555 [Desulfurellales bacterium]
MDTLFGRDRLRYLDRDGQPISRAVWWELIRCPEYTSLSRKVILVEGREVEVEASWVGVASSREPRPTIFLVTARQYDSRIVQVVGPIWCETMEQAMVEMDAVVALLEA